MFFQRLRPLWAVPRFVYFVVLCALALISILASGAYAALGASRLTQEDAGVAEAATTVTHVLPYQGRLLDPESGAPKPDGDYTMTFRLYTAESGGAALWEEGKIVPVANGLFSTFLGDATPLNLSHFDGQNLWVGVTVGSDPEATPRLRLGFAAYAFFAESAAHADNAAALGGQPPAAYAAAEHNHDGRYYTKTEADDRYITGEGLSTVTAESGSNPVLTVTQQGTHDGVAATTLATDPGRAALYGRAGSAGPTINAPAGVFGTSSENRGVVGSSTSSDAILGFSASGNGIHGQSNSGTGVRAFSSTGTALVVQGSSTFSGPMSKPTGSFKIDHPLDPENKYLYHSFVESPDMMNVYNGNVTLDAMGEAWVVLPDYFEALNRDFRYQLTPIGAPGPNLYIAQEVQGNRFKIAGGAPNASVSWQVTGIRHDPYAEANPIQVEVDKPEHERGTYLYPEAYGIGIERSLDARLYPEILDFERSE